MKISQLFHWLRKLYDSNVVLAIATIFSATAVLAYAYPRWLHISDFDGIANLNVARFLTHSFTPGFSQIGVWNLLNHMLLAPAVAVDFWYTTGVAGFIVHVPSLFLTAYCINRLCMEVTDDVYASLVAALIFVFNPYVLIFTVSPMSEPVFFLLLAASAMYFAQWVRRDSMEKLLLSAACIALSSVARFEAFALVPMGVFAVILTGLHRKYSWSRLSSEVLLFGLIACLGSVFVVFYSWFYTGNPLYFISYSAVRDTADVTVHTMQMISDGWWNAERVHSFLPTLYEALRLQFSLLILVVAATGMTWLAVRRQRWTFLMTIIVLLAPTLFVAASYVTGKRYIGVPPFYPQYVNIRYVLHVGVALSLFCSCSIAALRSSGYHFVRRAGFGLGIVSLVASIFFSAHEFYLGSFQALRNNVAYAGNLSGATSLSEVYDFGNVLISHGDNETFIFESHIPLERIVYESNYLYYMQTIREPWLFVRWVVLNMNDGIARDQISRVFFYHVNKDIFSQYYELVLEDGGRKIYRVRESVVRDVAKKLGYDPKLIPTLNTDAKWDPAKFYEQLKASKR